MICKHRVYVLLLMKQYLIHRSPQEVIEGLLISIISSSVALGVQYSSWSRSAGVAKYNDLLLQHCLDTKCFLSHLLVGSMLVTDTPTLSGYVLGHKHYLRLNGVPSWTGRLREGTWHTGISRSALHEYLHSRPWTIKKYQVVLYILPIGFKFDSKYTAYICCVTALSLPIMATNSIVNYIARNDVNVWTVGIKSVDAFWIGIFTSINVNGFNAVVF